MQELDEATLPDGLYMRAANVAKELHDTREMNLRLQDRIRQHVQERNTMMNEHRSLMEKTWKLVRTHKEYMIRVRKLRRSHNSLRLMINKVFAVRRLRNGRVMSTSV